MSASPPGVDAVLARAAHEGQAWVDEDVARRIAAGAAAATGAIPLALAAAPALERGGPDATPAAAVDAGQAFLGVLESLARDIA
ncbi:MAG: hypothetical protein U1F08_13135 [Steroidobacteraceae bacterium]